MNILTISTYPLKTPLHGGQRRLSSLVAQLRACGNDVRSVGVNGHPSYPSEEGFLEYPGDEVLRKIIPELFAMEDLALGKLLSLDSEYYRLLATQFSFRPDIIICEQPWLYSFAKRFNNEELGGKARLVYGSQNVEHELKYSITEKFLGSSKAKLCREQVLEWELHSVRDAELVLCVSDYDLQWAVANGAREAVLAANGVEDAIPSLNDISEANKLTGGRPFALYCASGHPPNVTGFYEVFKNGIGCFPPGTQLVVLGGAADAIQNDVLFQGTAGLSSVFLNAGVVGEHMLRGLVASAHMILLPITEGGGTNLKTAEAIWSGRYVVGTRRALRGFEHFVNSRGVFVADTNSVFLSHIRRCFLSDPLQLTVEERNGRHSVTWQRTLSEAVARIDGLGKNI